MNGNICLSPSLQSEKELTKLEYVDTKTAINVLWEL